MTDTGGLEKGQNDGGKNGRGRTVKNNRPRPKKNQDSEKET